MAIEVVTVDRAFCPLDLLLWRRLKREVPGLLEATLKANPGLSALGAILPIGTPVRVPMPDPAAREPRKIITLWSTPTS